MRETKYFTFSVLLVKLGPKNTVSDLCYGRFMSLLDVKLLEWADDPELYFLSEATTLPAVATTFHLLLKPCFVHLSSLRKASV
jgi:hypothetical protein